MRRWRATCATSRNGGASRSSSSRRTRVSPPRSTAPWRCTATATSSCCTRRRGRQRLARSTVGARASARRRRDRAHHERLRRRDVPACQRGQPAPARGDRGVARCAVRAGQRRRVGGTAVARRAVRVHPTRMPRDRGRVRRRPAGQRLRASITDFCLRAASAGFRHQLAGDVFIGHVGHVSFGPQAEALRERAVHALDRLYPALRGAPRRDPGERSRATLRAPRRSAASCAVAEAHARVRVSPVGRRHPPAHERSRGADRRARHRPVPRAGGRRHRQALLAAPGRGIRGVLPVAVRSSQARRHAQGHSRFAAALPSRARAAARDPRPARGARACRTTARSTTTTRSARNITSSPRMAGIAASPTRPAARHALRSAPRSGASTSARGGLRSASCCAARTALIAPSGDVSQRIGTLFPRHLDRGVAASGAAAATGAARRCAS